MAAIVESVMREDLNILVVSSNQEVLYSLQKNIHATWMKQREDRQYHCKVHICPNLALVDDQMHQIHFDFIVFVIEPNLVGCLNEVEANLNYLGKQFSRRQICLVAVGANYSTAIKPDELWTFAQVYHFNLLIGGIQSPEKAEHLSKRILNLSEACCGIINGIPLVGNI